MIVVRAAVVSALALVLWLHAAPASAAPDQPRSQLVVHVVDAAGAPIGGARVSVYASQPGDARSGATNRDGTRVFVDLNPGRYLVDVEASGFATSAARRVTLDPGASRDLLLTLAVGSFETHVVVTASDTVEPRDDISKALSVVDRQEIEARSVNTVSDAIREVPGARIEQLGGLGSQTSIRLRGLRSQDTGVLIDGVPFRDLSATQGDATSFVSDLLLTNVDRVEVLRGSGADVYGSNAVGGAVNVILRPGGEPTSGEALVEGGGLGLVRTRGQVGGGLSNGHATYSAGASGLNMARGIDGRDRAWNTSLQARMTARLGGTTVSAFLHGARAFTALNATPLGIGTLTGSGALVAIPLSRDLLAQYQSGTPVARLDIGSANVIPSADDPDNTRRSNSSLASIELTNHVFDRLAYSVSYHRLSTTRNFENGPLGVGFQPAGMSRADFDGGINTFRAKSDFQLGASQLITGAYQVERERYASASIPVGPAPPSSVGIAEWTQTASIQDRARIFDGSFQLTGGLRAQFFSPRTPRFAPITSAPYQSATFQAPPSAYTGDASAAYVVSATKTKLRAHVGSGYREPSLFERFGTSFGSRGYSIYGDPRLGPERSISVDVGVDQEVPRGRSRLSTSVFTTHLDHVIVFDASGVITRATDPFGRASGYRTIPGGRASGVELSARTEPTPGLILTGSYTLTTESSSDGPADPSLSFGVSRHQAAVRAISHVGSRLEMAALWTAASSYLAPISDAATFVSRSYRFRGVRRVDVSASYTRPFAARRGVRVFGRLDNITNQVYFESGFRTPGHVAALGVAVEF